MFRVVQFLGCAVLGLVFTYFHARAQEGYQEITVRDGGVLTGIVTLRGQPPPVQALPVTKDMKVCGASSTTSRLSVGHNGGVANAVVVLRDIHAGKAFSKKKVTLDQVKCEYRPHVLALAKGTPFEIMNGDPILHNVHAYQTLASSSRSIFNIAQPVRGQRTAIRPEQLEHPGLITATCDAGHPWMNAYIMVADNPYFAVTDADGRFKIDNIPPGTYTVAMWHEGVHQAGTENEQGKAKKYSYEPPYEQEKHVTIVPRGKAELNFEMTLR